MKISYLNTFRDLLEFQLYHLQRSPGFIVLDLGCVALLSYLFFPSSSEGIGLAPRLVGTVFFVAPFLLILLAVQLAIVALFLVSRRNKTLLTEHTITLGEDGFVEETSYARTDHKWLAVQKLSRTRRHLFIYVAQQGAHVIPRRAFRDEAEWNAFHLFCRRKTAPGPASTLSAPD